MSEGFLILSRNPQQGVTITVPASETETVVSVSSLGVKGRQVKLGFKANSNVKVLRDELIKHDTAEKNRRRSVMSGFTFTRKKGQKIIIINDQAMPVSLIEMVGRKVDEKGGLNRLKICIVKDGEIIRNDRTRRDGEQFEVGEVVFSVNADSKTHRTAFTIEKFPHYLQVARYENYQKALNG